MERNEHPILDRITQRRLPWELLLLALLAVCCLLLPLVHYTYSETVYKLNGFHLITGVTVSGGTVKLGPNLFLILSAAGIALWLIAFCVAGKHRETAGMLTLAGAVVILACMALFFKTAEGAISLAGAKRVGARQEGLLLPLVACLAAMDAMLLLYSAGRLKKHFDLPALSLWVLASLLAPLGTYTYKKTSHFFSGLDMMGLKEIASETFSRVSVWPWLLGALAVACCIISLMIWKREKQQMRTLMILSLLMIFCSILMATSVMDSMQGAKDAKRSMLMLVPVALELLLLGRILYIEYRLRMVSALDFMVLPGLVYLLINNYLPMVGISLAFKRIDYTVGIWKSPWVGLDNFKYLFSTDTAWIITRNTILYNLAFIVIGLFTGMVVGICMAAVTKKFIQKFYQTSILLPQLISMIVVAYIVFGFLSSESGFINRAILGKGNEINFYAQKGIWPFLLVVIHNWKQVGYNSVIFLSSIVGIDQGLYEAAMVDGCSQWKQITKITIPQLKPTIITLFLLQTGRVFYSDFGLFYQVPLDSGVLYPVTNTIDTFVYRSMMVLNNLSSASAASAFQSVCGFILVLTVNMIVRKVDNENALF